MHGLEFRDSTVILYKECHKHENHMMSGCKSNYMSRYPNRVYQKVRPQTL